MKAMQTYLVGGAVRDKLLGLPAGDRDFVVVGETQEAMHARGFKPVGRDFPVFLHPHTGEEYALARTERKSGRGYRGFVVDADPSVSLEEDLGRRDFTINAIAEDDTGQRVDPYGGVRDLEACVLRHVGPAFVEDPLRVLRAARFMARFASLGFSIAPETMTLMQAMVASGELATLVPERVWQELARGLMEDKPSRMFEVLRECGALQKLLPEVDRLWGMPQRADCHPEVDSGLHLMRVLDLTARLQAPLTVRFACLMTKLGSDSDFSLLKGLCERLRVPTDCREMAEVMAREHGNIHRSGEFSAAAAVRLLERCDAFRKPRRFADILLACECDARGQGGLENAAYPQRQRLLQALAAAQSVTTDQVAADAQAAGQSGKQIGEWIRQARVSAVSLNTDFATRLAG